MKNIPERIAFLVLLFLHKQLSSKERKELDAWILGSEENELLFEKATETPDRFSDSRLSQLLPTFRSKFNCRRCATTVK